MAYIFLKWVLFWAYQFVESDEKTQWNWSNLNNTENIIYTFGLLLLLPAIEILILSGGFYVALKQRGFLLIVLLLSMFALEFIIGWYGTNQQFAVWMAVKIILSITLFYFFYREKLVFKTT